jgi:peptidylprolyl isomerase
MKSVLIGLIALLVIAGVVIGVIAMNNNSSSNNGSNASDTSPSSTPSGLQITDVKVGDGAVAQAGDSLTVSYVGTLQDGSTFDQNANFTFTVGVGQVIKGWDKGIVGMKVGGERKLVIPADLAYGNQAVGSIPPNSTLLFDVKLLDVKPGTSTAPVQ